MTVKEAIRQVEGEVMDARRKFPPFNSPHEGYAVIKEELDELWAEVCKKKKDYFEMIWEARQVAAMGIRFMLDMDFEKEYGTKEAGDD